MYTVMGITGRVGSVLGHDLLAAGLPLRAVVQDDVKSRQWASRGGETAVAQYGDVDALTNAFRGSEAVFVMLPPNADPEHDFSHARHLIDAIRQALAATRPRRVVCLSSVGADCEAPSLLTALHMLETAMVSLSLPVTFLRPAWLMENFAWDIEPARERGELPSYLQPVDRAIPMASTSDVGHFAARAMQEDFTDERVWEIEGPERYSPDDIAAALARVLVRDVRAEAVPRAGWDPLFRAQGMRNPMPRIQMLDGFNNDAFHFRDDGKHALRGNITLVEAIAALVRES
ncbi:NmrA family NAD(P)-binding protein [Pandoraea terrigena]|uniref:NmrA family transcriptional regulator n=1 Tax=Pandoraea terrigena TaxID=2508292 RepID=A0A5E4Y437_9BURK|nr:NmrA family NAD(P)-binding protein [Pandoraea terrigena]VVE43370.1 NmrA family transcriptional regulator [Pandoraea terrigena]